MAARDRKKRRGSSSAVVLLNGLMTLLVLGLIAAGAVLYFGLRLFNDPGPTTEQAAFLIERGNGMNTIATRLEEQGLISNGLLFRVGYQVTKREANILPGQYLIPAGASMDDILTIITETKPQEFFVNVIPGETSFEVAEYINDPGQNLTGETVAIPAEGSLLAVRHDYFPGDVRADVIAGMQKAMTDEVARIWASRDPSIDEVVKSPEELVTLASLVEKETGLGTERPQVASVFINRLKRSMRLQTDPTVIYGITLGKEKLDRKLTTADLQSKTEYNTYQIDGLPPGPIANPGVEALEAVAHPADTNYLYFVARTDDPADGHLFAATYAEHRRNVTTYRQAVRAAAEQAEADAAKDALEAEQAQEAGDTTQ